MLLPLTLLIAATLIVFGAWPGAAYALTGALVSAALAYAIGRVVGRDTVTGWLGRRGPSGAAALAERAVRHGLVSVALVRLTPIPFTLVNLVAGAARVGFVDFLVGTALGLLPVTLLFAGLANRVEAWLADPDPVTAAAIVGIVVAIATALWALRRWATRRGSRGDGRPRD